MRHQRRVKTLTTNFQGSFAVDAANMVPTRPEILMAVNIANWQTISLSDR
jgi:hypothetical protein